MKINYTLLGMMICTFSAGITMFLLFIAVMPDAPSEQPPSHYDFVSAKLKEYEAERMAQLNNFGDMEAAALVYGINDDNINSYMEWW